MVNNPCRTTVFTRVFPGATVSGVVGVFALTAFLVAGLLTLRPRFLLQQGIRQLNTGSPARAAAFFDHARAAMPGFLSRTWVTAEDRFRLDTYHGRAVYETAKADWQRDGLTPEVHARLLDSRKRLERAAAAEPGYYLTAYWLARTGHALERSHAWLFPETPNPFDADSLYLRASALRPAGITVRQAHALYLYETGRAERIPALVNNMTAIYPPAYESLKKETWFTPDLLPHMARGLEIAVQNRVRPRDALVRLSRLYQDQDRPAAAIDAFEAYLAHDPGANTAGDFFHLGTLCLRDGRFEKSRDAFVQSLSAAGDREAMLNRIYRHFRSLSQHTRFLSFMTHLEDTALAVPGQDMALARCYLDMDQLFLAKQTLTRIMDARPTGEAASLLAVIAAKEKDWDAMEVLSHQATRLDPYNAGYHFLFARALNYRKKYANAEKAITRAIELDPENAGYQKFRDQIRQK